MKSPVVVPLTLVMAGVLGACTFNPNFGTSAILKEQSFSYIGMTVDHVIDDADAILIGKVVSVSPSRWNQNNGEYWEDIDSGMANLQYYEVTLEVIDAIVNEIGIGDKTTITVLGPSPADLAFDTGSPEVQHAIAIDAIPFQEGEKVLIFAEKRKIAWRGGPVEKIVLVGGPQGKYTLTDDGRALNALPERDSRLSALLEQIAARRHVES